MNVTPLAITWAAGGAIAAAVLPRIHRRQLAALLPLSAAFVALISLGGDGADLAAAAGLGGLSLGRPAQGLALVCALSVTVTLLLAPPPDRGDILVIATCGALSTVALGTGSPVVWSSCLLAGAAVIGVHWVTIAPSRVTLGAARAGSLAAAVLLAASPFLPIDNTAIPPRAHLASALLAVGIAGGLALVPMGGWVVSSARALRGPALAPWALLLMPALLLTAQPVLLILPVSGRSVFAGIAVAAGTATALWSAVNSLLAVDNDRYLRVLLGDLGLMGVGLASSDNSARFGSLLLLITHLCLAPLLLRDATAPLARPRRLAWLALSGIPPSPAFWGRFSLLVGIAAGLGLAPLLVMVPVGGALLAVSVRAIAAAAAGPPPEATQRAARLAAWLPPLAALTVGLLPGVSLRVLLGVG